MSLLTQYNPHVLRSAPESLGFSGARVERAIRWVFVISFVLAVAAFGWLGILGHDFVTLELIVLTINWTVLIASGVAQRRVQAE